MAELYLRKAVLNVAPRFGQGGTIDQLRIQFEIEKTSESNPNTATIKVYNLAESTRSQLEASNAKVSLEVGYRDISEVVFTGDITKCTHDTENDVDIISTLECGDGDNRFRTSRLDRGFPPGTTVRQVIEELNTAMGLARGAQIGIPTTKYDYGYSISGMARDHLNDITKANNLEWSIQNEALQILPKALGTLDLPITLNSSSGLVGKPSKTDKGVTFKCLINPRIAPGKRVILDSKFIQGVFKMTKVKFAGDSQQGDFLAECEGVTG